MGEARSATAPDTNFESADARQWAFSGVRTREAVGCFFKAESTGSEGFGKASRHVGNYSLSLLMGPKPITTGHQVHEHIDVFRGCQSRTPDSRKPQHALLHVSVPKPSWRAEDVHMSTYNLPAVTRNQPPKTQQFIYGTPCTLPRTQTRKFLRTAKAQDPGFGLSGSGSGLV